MENTQEKETHDFMNVQSFSQLPFIRPAPPVKEKSIRLFGKEFGGSDVDKVTADESNSLEIIAQGEFSTTTKENENGESNRKFECHYCCRNFPTSQALGGHQNAHKRERQHAKRAHLQSTIVHGGYPEANMYGIMNYHRFAPSPSSALTYHSSSPWSSSNNFTNSRFYGGHTSYSQPQQPITGNPLALWRVPSLHTPPPSYNNARDVKPPPLFAHDEIKAFQNVGSSNSQSRYVYESKASVKDHVSLDLRL
ncbi:putative sphingosine-1-phosphate phosphohydrolase [Heracleum sosnowskyi]|uniref:Sphingosine-1-phosphate phosphohydrolase n=1 Tax=Heracleum sosnowskyi TaxID=360622 RepID=A0AAD8J5M7_9APIA|nr:putative sphingosine-1-phosphate phosphohydrolase [Heracleum sosnowskyi]